MRETNAGKGYRSSPMLAISEPQLGDVSVPASARGAHRLLSAVFAQSMIDFSTYEPGSKTASAKDYRSAEEWFFDGEQDLFSFEFACTVFKLDPDAVRLEVERRAFGMTVGELHEARGGEAEL